MPRPKQVRITKGHQEGFCLESSVAAWERNGWTRADDGSSETPSTPKEPAEAGSDPEDHQRKAE